MYTGPFEQGYQAYRVHTGAIRFSWHERSVEDRLTDLPEKDWKKAHPAFEWLREAEGSAYKSFLAGHHAFLEQRAQAVAAGDMDVDKAVKWLPLRFMETVGLECAVWPHLYWDKTMTETYVRSQDARRQARNRKQRKAAEEDEEDMILQAEEAGDASTEEEVEEEKRRPARARRQASWPRPFPQSLATEHVMNCNTLSTIFGFPVPCKARRMPLARPFVARWQAVCSALCIGKPCTKLW